MKVADSMTRRVFSVHPEDSVERAARLMLEHHISGIPVVDHSGRLMGIVTEGDLLRRAEAGTERRHPRWLELLLGPGRLAEEYTRAHAREVKEVMTTHVISVMPETPLEEAVALMERYRIKRLPVVGETGLLGILSRANLLSTLINLAGKPSPTARSDGEIRKRVLAAIDAQRWSPRTGIDVAVLEGVAELRGVIFDERERAALRVVVQNVPGVKDVVDHLVWVEPVTGAVLEAPQRDQETARPAK